MISKLVAALQQLDPEVTAESVADTIWLALEIKKAVEKSGSETVGLLPDIVTSPKVAEEHLWEDKAELLRQHPTSKETDEHLREDKTELPPQQPVPGKSAFTSMPQPPSAGLYPGTSLESGSKGRQIGVLPFRSPAATALPGSRDIARTLRPFRRRIPLSRKFVLNEEATARRIAEEGLWVPVLDSASTRWLDVALVVDKGTSMTIWRQTIAELHRLLACHGAFRDVRLWELDTNDAGMVRLYAGTGVDTQNRQPHSELELIDTSGRRLILVVTDCVSPAWHSGAVANVLTKWGHYNSVTLVQVLPQRLWSRTALGMIAPVRLHASVPGIPNKQFLVQATHYWDDENETYQQGVAIPIVTLEPRPLAAWSRVIARAEDLWIPGFELVAGSQDGAEEGQNGYALYEEAVTVSLFPAERMQRFRANASSLARKLAELLAVVPISLPIIRLIQQTMLSESRQVHVAEVFLSGLLEVVSPDSSILDPDYVQYDFVEGVRELMLNSVPPSDSIRVLQETSAFIVNKFGSALDFRALLANPLATEGVAIGEESRPFAIMAAKALRRFGGDYVLLAEWLEEEASKGQKPLVPVNSSIGIEIDLLTSKQVREEDEEVQRKTPRVGLKTAIARRKAFRTMFIGLGGTGNEVVRRVKQEMLRHDYDLPIFQYLVLDTVAFNEAPGMSPLMQLRNGEEYLYIGGYNPNEIVTRIDKWPVIAHWWGARDNTNLVTVDEGAGQMRSVGRMGFFRHFTTIQARLDQMVHEVLSNSNREFAVVRNFDVPMDKAPIVYLVFSLCGGTGSSLFFDVAYVLRKLFGEKKPIIVGLAMLPGPYVQDIQSIPQKERIQANTYAALQELERLHNIGMGIEKRPNGRDVWDVQYATNFRVSSPDLPFDYIYLIDDTSTRGEKYRREPIYGLMSQAIFWLSAPSTAARFWERAKNLTSNTLAAGGSSDGSGRIRLSKYSSLGIAVARLGWRFERVQHELESLILKEIQTRPAGKPILPKWLSDAYTLIAHLDEPDVNPIPKEFTPLGTFRDRSYVDETLESYTTRYEAALGSFPHLSRWQHHCDRYRRDAFNELDMLFRKSLVERGPIAAVQEMEIIKERLQTIQSHLDELHSEAARSETALRIAYDNSRRWLQSESGFAQLMNTLIAGVRRLYGVKPERELTALALNLAHGRYLWYLERYRMILYRDAKKYILEPTLAHAEKLKALLEGVDYALDSWQDRLRQDISASLAANASPGFDAVIHIYPRRTEQQQIREAIKRGDIKPDVLMGKVLKQAFDSWPKEGEGNIVIDLQDALSSLVFETLQLLDEYEYLLDRLLDPDAWGKRALFLSRADCLWSFDKSANQQVLPHLEAISVLGYAVDDTLRQPRDIKAQLDELLKQQPNPPELVPTDISSELAYLTTLHGLPISLIRSMPELHHAYQVMNVVRSAPYLHIDYRDQVQAGYGPLVRIEMTSQQIIDTWKQVADDVEHTRSELAKSIRDQVLKYESQSQTKFHETVQVLSENDPFFDLVDAIENITIRENRTLLIAETLIKLSELIGLLHAQGWVMINPAYGSQFDPMLHEVMGSKDDPDVPGGRIVEVKRRGYIHRQPNQSVQIRKAWVIVSTGRLPSLETKLDES